MLENRTVVRRVAFVLAMPVATAALIGIAQLVAPSPERAATELVGTGGRSDLQASLTTDGDVPAAPTTSSPVASSPAPSPAGAGAGGVATVISGRYLLRGPSTVAAGASVLFVLQGPARVVRGARTAPFVVPLDTRTVPDGAYHLVVSTVSGGQRTVVRTGLVTVANHGRPGSASASAAGGASTGPDAGRAASPSTVATVSPAPNSRPTHWPTQSAGGGQSGQGGQVPAAGSFADQVVTLTNAQRAGAGCPALTVDATLTSVAQAHSQDMAVRRYFDHNSPDGRSPFDRMTAAGYQFRAAAENIAAGQRTPQEVVTAWMNSAGHRANILNCGLTQIGVGYATGGSYGSYWTQDFGTPR